MKECSKCHQILEKVFFHKCKNTKDGLNYFCKKCNLESVKKYKNENLEKVRIANGNYRLKNIERRLFNAVKYRCKKENIPFNISIEDIVLPEYCPLTRIKIDYGVNKGRHKANPSIDKIIPSLGYIKGNIQILSDLGNRMKSDASIEELQIFATEVLKKWPV